MNCESFTAWLNQNYTVKLSGKWRRDNPTNKGRKPMWIPRGSNNSKPITTNQAIKLYDHDERSRHYRQVRPAG